MIQRFFNFGKIPLWFVLTFYIFVTVDFLYYTTDQFWMFSGGCAVYFAFEIWRE